jgi:hypothetical protein
VLDGRAIGGMAVLLPTIISDPYRVVVKLSLTNKPLLHSCGFNQGRLEDQIRSHVLDPN